MPVQCTLLVSRKRHAVKPETHSSHREHGVDHAGRRGATVKASTNSLTEHRGDLCHRRRADAALCLLQASCNKTEDLNMRDLMVEATATARAGGGRMTAQRRLILRTLNELGGHPTADEICAPRMAGAMRSSASRPPSIGRWPGWKAPAWWITVTWMPGRTTGTRSASTRSHRSSTITSCARRAAG